MTVCKLFNSLVVYEKNMRTSNWGVFFSAPQGLSEFQILKANQRFKRLEIEIFIGSDDYEKYNATISCIEVRDWLKNSTIIKKECAIKVKDY